MRATFFHFSRQKVEGQKEGDLGHLFTGMELHGLITSLLKPYIHIGSTWSLRGTHLNRGCTPAPAKGMLSECDVYALLPNSLQKPLCSSTTLKPGEVLQNRYSWDWSYYSAWGKLFSTCEPTKLSMLCIFIVQNRSDRYFYSKSEQKERRKELEVSGNSKT